MKSKGRKAWLITWEGSESEFNGRCKVVAILPARYGDDRVKDALRILYHSEYNFTLGEKMIPNYSVATDNFFVVEYKQMYPQYRYGHFDRNYLRAREVKNLWCEEGKKDCFENTLSWTELPKFNPNPKYGELGSPDAPDSLIQVYGEREEQYTYSIRGSIEEEKKGRRNKNVNPEYEDVTAYDADTKIGDIWHMKIPKTSLRGFIVFMVVFLLIQPSTMYLFYHVFHWNFFVSEGLSAILAGYPAFLLRVVVEKRSKRHE